jgi:hypothetical protein
VAKKKGDAPYEVRVDTREQQPWAFPAGGRCLGTVRAGLPTGDYTLTGFEGRFVIERKGSAAEFAQNLFQPRFHRELARLDEVQHPYLFLEFDWARLVEFPAGSGVPESKWRFLKVTPQLLVKAYHEMRLAHPRLRVEFVGAYGREAASSLFKRVVDAG